MIVIYAGAAALLILALLSLRRIPFAYVLGNLKARRVSLALSIIAAVFSGRPGLTPARTTPPWLHGS